MKSYETLNKIYIVNLQSLTTRNTLLLEEKNAALAQSKEDMEKMDATMVSVEKNLIFNNGFGTALSIQREDILH